MPIYRGDGGSGDSTTDAYASQVAQDAAIATEKANEAAVSATEAANSATNAATSETNAATSETNAATSETNAATSASNASTSETNAATSATNAATSETNAATSATNAATSETNASSSATAAANSATAAATSETNAATSATNAATSETNAATSATNSANSATAAATSATAAATSASDAATSYDNFDDRYLGAKTSDPSVDNDGDALITGALYFNSTAGQMRVWDGSAWEAAYLPGSGYLQTSGSTATDLAITSADINGGNIDGTIIGATTPAAATVAAFTSNGIDDNANQSALLLDSVGYTTLVHSQQTTGEGLNLQNLNTNLSVGTAINFELPAVGTGTEASIDYKNTGSAGNFQLNLGVGSISARVSDMTLNSSGEVIFSTFSTERMRINSSGTVQVGGTGSGLLELLGSSSGSEGGQLNIECTGSTGTFSIDSYNDRLRFLNGPSTGKIQFYTASNAAIGMEMAEDGELKCHKGITIDGTDSTTGVNLNITGANPEIKFEETDGDTWWIHVNNSIWYLLQDKNADGTWSSPHPLVINGTNETISFYNVFLTNTSHDLHVDGNVVAYSTSVSDERLKDDIQPITGALDTVDALRGVTFTWNDGRRKGTKDYGLIAQEVEKVIPEVVHDTDLPLMKGEDDKTVYKTIDYDKLVAVLIEAVSELRAEVEELRGTTN